jgi:putative spermidine/putrescine transport system ATP-binding protein
VVYVTHDQGEALTMSDRIAVFNDGRIQQLAPPADLYELPENSFVAGFIGENNKLPGTVEDIAEGRALVRLATGELIDATPVNVGGKGQPTLVSIRPERVEYKPEALPEGAHTLDAEVLEFIYMGDLFRTRLRVAGSDDFVIKSRNTAGQRMLRPGEKIRIGWAPQDARALDPA